jgi:nucleoside-diphosphate-sugar epimerase
MPSQSALRPGYDNIPKRCLVTGGSGFVGRRLVEMLAERGCELVLSFDINALPVDPSGTSPSSSVIQYIQGDLTNYSSLQQMCSAHSSPPLDCIFHIAALVGPYHPKEAYYQVNYLGTENILKLAREFSINKIVMSSSPSTRFPYPDPNINYLTEDELYEKNQGDYAPVFLQPYAETKALGEDLIRKACGGRVSGETRQGQGQGQGQGGDLLTIAVAPHQVYGPRDNLFLPNLLEAAGSNKLRIFGEGKNMISFCHVDNYCHGLILGAEALYPTSPALGKFYIITDGPPINFWQTLDQAVMAMGFVSLFQKFHLPVWFMMALAYLTVFLGDLYAAVTGTPKHVVNYYLKLNPFAVKMLVIDR